MKNYIKNFGQFQKLNEQSDNNEYLIGDNVTVAQGVEVDVEDRIVVNKTGVNPKTTVYPTPGMEGIISTFDKRKNRIYVVFPSIGEDEFAFQPNELIINLVDAIEGGNEQTNIIDEVLKYEVFDLHEYEIVSFDHEDKDSIIEVLFLPVEETHLPREAFLELKVVFNFYYSLRGEYVPAKWDYFGGEDEQGPEEEFYLIPDVKEIMYLEFDDKGTEVRKHELTEEQKKIAIPKAIESLMEYKQYIVEELQDRLNSY